MLKVVKFGGSSLADGKQFAKVRAIVESDPARRVVVVSAPGKRKSDDHKITDLLYLCAAHKEYGVGCEDIFSMIRERYEGIARDCGLKTDITGELDQLWRKIQKGIDREELASRGEYLAARLMADYLGFDFVDAALWVKFKFDGSVDKEASYEALRRAAEGRRVVIPGFYGAMPDGRVRTLTRGGSDITGALAAAALDADLYENWTDVSGILMADPKIVPDPAPIRQITYSALRELSYIGAKVLHEGTVFPVREKNIPLNIRNTNEPDHPGTLILEHIQEEGDEGSLITGIAGKKGYSVITVAKTGMSSETGVLLRILEIVEKHGVNVEYIPSGIDILSLVFASEKAQNCLYEILGEIQKELSPDTIKVTEHLAIVAAVGRRMASRPGVSGKIFATLGENGVNIRMITQGPEELNIIVGVEEKDFAQAIRVLYDTFVKEERHEAV
ncbi:MAG: aspartate kinase [Clostridia bacterium]|nr:aspartate kinase [Clostridia bacterium]